MTRVFTRSFLSSFVAIAALLACHEHPLPAPQPTKETSASTTASRDTAAVMTDTAPSMTSTAAMMDQQVPAPTTGTLPPPQQTDTARTAPPTRTAT